MTETHSVCLKDEKHLLIFSTVHLQIYASHQAGFYVAFFLFFVLHVKPFRSNSVYPEPLPRDSNVFPHNSERVCYSYSKITSAKL